MVDLGFMMISMDAINLLVILTALILAAGYLGFDVIAAIGGLLAIVYGIRIAVYGDELRIYGYEVGVYEAWGLVGVGGFLLYRGTTSFFDGKDVNTWK